MIDQEQRHTLICYRLDQAKDTIEEARKYGEIAREAFEVRQKGDYDTYVEFSKDDVMQKYGQMKDFVKAIEQFIFSEGSETESR